MSHFINNNLCNYDVYSKFVLVCDVFWQSTFIYVGCYTEVSSPTDPPSIVVVSTPVSFLFLSAYY